MAHILVVDDDSGVLGTVWRALNREGHDVVLAESAEEARQEIDKQAPDLIVLDVMMPHFDGIMFCEELRSTPVTQFTPILFLSAKGQVNDVVRGLDAGGDDYLKKPFHLKELTARVRVLLRRSPEEENDGHTLMAGDLTLDLNTYQVTRGEEVIQLTTTEFRLLHHLMKGPNQAHNVQELLDAVWDYPPGTGDPDLVRAHIRNLRAKIEPNPRQPTIIQTIHGVGYMLNA